MGRSVAALQAPEPHSANIGMREATSPAYGVGGYRAGVVASPGTTLVQPMQGSGVPSFGPPSFAGGPQHGYGGAVMPMHAGTYQHGLPDGHMSVPGHVGGMGMPGETFQQQSMQRQQMSGQYGMPPANAGYAMGGAAFL
jgi:hypothetical protein